VLSLDPGNYQRHAVHRGERTWVETNCYVDVWIELLHALGHEPLAALPFTFATDFEGDQWTFFKFPLADLHELFGLDVQELAIWRPLVAHLEEQVARGRPVLVELDSFYLPDTAGTAYKRAHVKTTVAVVEIDAARSHLGYFHGPGYFYLSGDDFLDALRARGPQNPEMLPPYAEFVRIREGARLNGHLLPASLALLRKHLSLVPDTNPFVAFAARLERDLEELLHQDLEAFHQYAFATWRQYGACYELAASYLQWLAQNGELGLNEPIAAFHELSEGAKTLQFQLARAMARRTPLDLTPFTMMAMRWESGIAALKARYQ
jgi:hypothetical protein